MFDFLKISPERLLKHFLPTIIEQAPTFANMLFKGMSEWLAAIPLEIDESRATILISDNDGQIYLDRVVWNEAGTHITRVVDTYCLNFIASPQFIEAVQKVDAKDFQNIMDLIKI